MFNSNVKKIAGETLVRHGFTLSNEFEGMLDYENEHIVVSFTYDSNHSYEADLTLLFKDDNTFYSYNELQEFFGHKVAHRATQITSEEVMKKWLKSVQEFLYSNLSDIVQYTEKTKLGLKKISNQRVKEYNRDREERYLLSNVEKYWNEKDYAGLVAFLKNYNGEIKGVVEKKYKYALKVIG